MTTSQSDVDKVMAAFGAAPISYRPNQEVAVPGGRATPAPSGSRILAERDAPPAPPGAGAERIAPGAGGRIREIFPLLSRAVPLVGDLPVGAARRSGDEISAERPPQPQPAREAPQGRVEPAAPPAAPAPSAAAAEQPAPLTAAAAQPPVPDMARPLPPLRSHAELIKPMAQPAPAPEPPPPAGAAPAPVPPPAPPPYPPYYPTAAMPPPYPMHPAALAWAQMGYPPPYPMPPAGYPPPHPAAYPPAYPPPPYPYGYGYPQQPPPYTAPHAPVPPPPRHPPPAPPQAPAAQRSLSEIFAALQQAHAARRGEETS